jgi:hypothetical protein
MDPGMQMWHCIVIPGLNRELKDRCYRFARRFVPSLMDDDDNWAMTRTNVRRANLADPSGSSY